MRSADDVEKVVGQTRDGHPRGKRGPGFSLSQFGLGFWQAWWVYALCSHDLLPQTAPHESLMQPTTAFLCLTTLGYLAMVILGRHPDAATRLLPSAARRTGEFLPTITIPCSLGSIGLALCTQTLLPWAAEGGTTACAAWWTFFIMSCTTFSAGNALLIERWGQRWSTMASGHVGRYVYMSYLVGITAFLIVSLFPMTLRILSGAVFPTISAVILRRATSDPRRDPPRVSYEQEHPSLARPLASVLVLNLVWGLALPCLTLLASGTLSVFGGLVLAALMLGSLIVYLALLQPETEAFVLMAPIGAAMATGLLLALVLPANLLFMSYGIATLGGACLDMLVMIVACDMALRIGESVSVTLGVAMVTSRVGSLAGRACYDLIAPTTTQLCNVLITCCAIAVVICCLLVFDQSHLQAIYRVRPALPREETLEDRCAALSAAAHLSSREGEILALLAHGRSAPYIAEQLSLSVGTVKNHVSTIYRKVGVGDRQSLLNAIELCVRMDTTS